jgi:hypothetical protein
MGISSANSTGQDDPLNNLLRCLERAEEAHNGRRRTAMEKDGRLSALYRDVPVGDAANKLSRRTYDDHPQLPTTLQPWITGDDDHEGLRTAISGLHDERQVSHLPRATQLPPIPGLPPLGPHRAVPTRVSIDRDKLMPMTRLGRRSSRAFSSGAAFLLVGTIAAAWTGYFVVASWPPAMDFAVAPSSASSETRFVPQAILPSGSEAAPEPQLTMLSEGKPTKNGIEARSPQTLPASDDRATGQTSAMPGLNAMPQSSPGSSVDGQDTTPLIAKERQVSLAVLPMLQAAPAPTLIAEASRHDDANAMLETQGRAPLAENPVDSHVRYFARAELENLSADQLYIARNEIFARKGRYFRDDKLKSHFEKLQWYRPSAWDVPLSPVEQANVALIQSLETPAAARSGVSRSVPTKKSVAKDLTLEDSSRQRLAREELQGLSASQLLIARNEIFARRGRYFKDEALRDYFSQFSWYQPSAWDVALSPVEQANVELIQSVEQSSASRHASSPGRVRRCEGTVC